MQRSRLPETLFLIIVAVGGSVWWLESRFGADVAVMVIGGLAGLIAFTGGALLVAGVVRANTQNLAQFNHDISQAEKWRQQAHREGLRAERDAFNARAKLTVLDNQRDLYDYRHDRRLADSQAQHDARAAQQQAQRQSWRRGLPRPTHHVTPEESAEIDAAWRDIRQVD